MKIYRYKKLLYSITNHRDLECFIKGLYDNFKCIPTHLCDEFNWVFEDKCIAKSNFIDKIKKIINGSHASQLTMRYWLNRGYNAEEAKNNIRLIQRQRSKRSVDYWVKNGYSESDAKNKVSEYQRKIGEENKRVDINILKQRSNRCVEFWVERGFNINEAKKIISQNAKKYAHKFWDNATEAERDKCRHVGCKNGMYGKPSPTGSGNGWSGWYDGYYFRSLKELSFLVLYIKRFNFSYINGEKLRIPYIDCNGINKTYAPDFIINEKYIVEIKPKYLFNALNVKLKAKYAIEYAKKHNMVFKMIDPVSLNMEEIIKLVDSGKLKFLNRYQEKYLNYIKKYDENNS